MMYQNQTETSEQSADRFQQLFGEVDSVAEYADEFGDEEFVESNWEMETSADLPESVVYDPEWAQLDAEGVTYRDTVRYAMPELAEYDDDDLDEAINEITAEMSEADIEGFFSSLKKIGRGILRVAAPIVRTAAPIVGGAIGGPVGAAVGNFAGNLVGRGARVLDHHLSRPNRGGIRRRRPRRSHRRGNSSRGRRSSYGRRRNFSRQFRRYAPTVRAAGRAIAQHAGPAVQNLGQQLQDPNAGTSLGQAAGQAIAGVAGRLSNIIGAQEMQIALSNSQAGLLAELFNDHGESVDSETMVIALREAILDAADAVEGIEIESNSGISSGELAEFVNA